MNNLVSGREVSAGGVMDGPPQGIITNEYGIGGDQITGKWINPRTGQTVFARQMIDNGGEALIVTDAGVIPMTQFSEFVQMGEKVIQNPTPQNMSIQSNIGGVQMSDEDAKLLQGLNTPKPQQYSQALDKPLVSTNKTENIEPKKSENYDIIDKLFKKFSDKIKINVSIDWNEFPKDKLETLTDIFDVPKKEIAQYLIEKYLNKDELCNEIEKGLE